MNQFLLFVCALGGFFGGFVWAADLQKTQCDIDTDYYREKPTIKKADDAAKRKQIGTEIKLYKIAASEENNPLAKVMLALSYMGGKDNPRNVPEAVRLIKSAAEQDFGFAQHLLGHFYLDGTSVAQNYSEALRWYKLAASKGCDESWRSLSNLYAEGKGTPQDYIKAHMWVNIKAAGVYDGENYRSKPEPILYSLKSDAEARDWLAKKMTPQQLNQAQQLATKCQAQNFKNCD